MESQKDVSIKGGTMRLGVYDCQLTPGSRSLKEYGSPIIQERHRHRFEYNNDYRAKLESAGLLVGGINTKTGLVEIVEVKDHPFMIGVQYHPEFKSKPHKAHPLFAAFVKAAIQKSLGSC